MVSLSPSFMRGGKGTGLAHSALVPVPGARLGTLTHMQTLTHPPGIPPAPPEATLRPPGPCPTQPPPRAAAWAEPCRARGSLGRGLSSRCPCGGGGRGPRAAGWLQAAGRELARWGSGPGEGHGASGVGRGWGTLRPGRLVHFSPALEQPHTPAHQRRGRPLATPWLGGRPARPQPPAPRDILPSSTGVGGAQAGLVLGHVRCVQGAPSDSPSQGGWGLGTRQSGVKGLSQARGWGLPAGQSGVTLGRLCWYKDRAGVPGSPGAGV